MSRYPACKSARASIIFCFIFSLDAFIFISLPNDHPVLWLPNFRDLLLPSFDLRVYKYWLSTVIVGMYIQYVQGVS